jgi:poly(A) polymerase/tRNA nucleotidyltransferase (CCA-adding enzyme)
MKIPEYIIEILESLGKNKFEAYIVGGCVRDLLMSRIPKDWDVTTNARPEEILKIFPDAKYQNIFGTVIIPIKENDEVLDVVEVTTYRSEQGYSDRRHPDEIKFEDNLDKDLERRDFTINAMALKSTSPNPSFVRRGVLAPSPCEGEGWGGVDLVDLFGGQKDIEKKIIRAVGEPAERFMEDALRMMRAVRFASELGFSIEPKTERAIVKLAGSIKFISQERIRDELIKILSSKLFYEGIMMLHDYKLLQYIIPELEMGVGVEQNRHHIYSVFNHSVLSLKFCPSSDWRVRLAALLHDIAKPQTKKFIGPDATFYNHDIVGAKIVRKIMSRLKFSNEDLDKTVNLVRHHMFYYNVGEVTESSVRRLIVKVGEENLKDLIDIRIADRLGSGVPKAKPYKLRHLEYMFDKVRRDPISVKMLKINGDSLMKLLNIEPGPKIGAILDVLLSDVLDDVSLNNSSYLEKRAIELDELDLKELRQKAKEKIDDKKMEDEQELKAGHYVK